MMMIANDRQRLRKPGVSDQQSTSVKLNYKRRVARWRWSHFWAPNPSRVLHVNVSHSAAATMTNA